MLTAVVGVAQTIVIARLFGATRLVEVFFAATTFNALMLQISTSGRVGDVFTPIFHTVRNDHGKDASRQAFSSMINTMSLFGLAGSLLAAGSAEFVAPWLVPGFGHEDQQLCARVFRVTSPLIFSQIIIGMLTNFMRAEKHYGVVESINFCSRLFNLMIVAFFGWWLGLWALILGLWVSAAFQLVGITIYVSRKMNYRHKWCFAAEHFRPKEVLYQLPFTFIHVISSQVFSFALTAGLSQLPEGSFATYRYAKQLVSRFQGIILQPISIVFFNSFSEAIAAGHHAVRSYAEHALALSIAVCTLCIAPLAVSGDYLLMGLWGGDNFSAQRITETHYMAVAIACSLIFSAQHLVTRRTNLAMKMVVFQFVSSGVALMACGLFCSPLISRFGLTGAILVQLLASIMPTAASIGALWWRHPGLVALLPLRQLVTWGTSAAIAVSISMLIRSFIDVDLSAPRLTLFSTGALLSSVAVLTCFLASWVLKTPESREILTKAQGYLKRRRLATNV